MSIRLEAPSDEEISWTAALNGSRPFFSGTENGEVQWRTPCTLVAFPQCHIGNYLVSWGGRMCQDRIEPPARRKQFWKRKVNCFFLERSAQIAWGLYSVELKCPKKGRQFNLWATSATKVKTRFKAVRLLEKTTWENKTEISNLQS